MTIVPKTKTLLVAVISVFWITRIACSQQPPATAPAIANFSATSSTFIGDTAILSGTIVGSNLPTVSVAISWGDNLEPELESLPAGTTNFNFSHVYSNNVATGTQTNYCHGTGGPALACAPTWQCCSCPSRALRYPSG